MSERNYDEHGMDVGRRFGGKLTEKEKRDREVEMRGWTPAVDWKVRALTAESALQVARDALREEQAKRDRVLDALYTAWTIIANAGRGDWHTESPEWEAAATRWRDEDFHPILQWSDRRLAPEVSPE